MSAVCRARRSGLTNRRSKRSLASCAQPFRAEGGREGGSGKAASAQRCANSRGTLGGDALACMFVCVCARMGSTCSAYGAEGDTANGMGMVRLTSAWALAACFLPLSVSSERFVLPCACAHKCMQGQAAGAERAECRSRERGAQCRDIGSGAVHTWIRPSAFQVL